MVSINWAHGTFSRSFSVVSTEHKDKRRRGCAQAMASGAATGYAYTKMSSCAGNRAVSLEVQLLFSTGRFGFAECCRSHNVSDIKDVVGGYILLDSAGVSTSCLTLHGWGRIRRLAGLKEQSIRVGHFPGAQNSDNMADGLKALHHSCREVSFLPAYLSQHIAQIYFGGL